MCKNKSISDRFFLLPASIEHVSPLNKCLFDDTLQLLRIILQIMAFNNIFFTSLRVIIEQPFLYNPMKSYHKELWMQVPARMDFVNITGEVEYALRESSIQEGLCLVNAMHITASVFINDDESGLKQDYKRWLEELAPHEPISRYRHNMTGEDNGDAHHKRQIMGREVVIAVTKGKLHFGPWEQIFYGEFDGMRKKRVLIKIIGE